MSQKRGNAGKVEEVIGSTLRSPHMNVNRIHGYFGRCHPAEEDGDHAWVTFLVDNALGLIPVKQRWREVQNTDFIGQHPLSAGGGGRSGGGALRSNGYDDSLVDGTRYTWAMSRHGEDNRRVTAKKAG